MSERICPALQYDRIGFADFCEFTHTAGRNSQCVTVLPVIGSLIGNGNLSKGRFVGRLQCGYPFQAARCNTEPGKSGRVGRNPRKLGIKCIGKPGMHGMVVGCDSMGTVHIDSLHIRRFPDRCGAVLHHGAEARVTQTEQKLHCFIAISFPAKQRNQVLIGINTGVHLKILGADCFDQRTQ